MRTFRKIKNKCAEWAKMKITNSKINFCKPLKIACKNVLLVPLLLAYKSLFLWPKTVLKEVLNK